MYAVKKMPADMSYSHQDWEDHTSVKVVTTLEVASKNVRPWYSNEWRLFNLYDVHIPFTAKSGHFPLY
jgi:hypothetical protein